jgi:hypothetical protein
MIRAVIFAQGELWIAQAIEHDISIDALTCNDAVNRLDSVIDVERVRCAELGRDLDLIPPAPETFARMWEAARSPIHFDGQFYWRAI